MPTIPTGELEREIRKRYLKFINDISMDSKNLDQRLRDFEASQLGLIERMGGRTAMLGALGDFPAPKLLDLSPWQGTIYKEMQTTAIQAGIIAGINSKEVAKAMFRAGMDKSYRKLERLARTETTNAYWKNAFGSIADLPALVMIWGSEDGPRTCAWCRERDGLVIEDGRVRDHPNGRCTPIPTLRSQVKYRGSVRSDGEIYHDPNWNQTTKRLYPIEEVTKPMTVPQAPAPSVVKAAALVAGKRATTVYTATAPDGTQIVRNSVRDYQWANIYMDDEGQWVLSQMTQSRASADNVHERLLKRGRTARIVPLGTG